MKIVVLGSQPHIVRVTILCPEICVCTRLCPWDGWCESGNLVPHRGGCCAKYSSVAQGRQQKTQVCPLPREGKHAGAGAELGEETLHQE